jgi:hypothetical protein
MVRLSNHAGKGLAAIHRRALLTIGYISDKHQSGQRSWFESLSMTAFFVALFFSIL